MLYQVESLTKMDLLPQGCGRLALSLDYIQPAIFVEVGQDDVERSERVAEYGFYGIDQPQIARSIVRVQPVGNRSEIL